MRDRPAIVRETEKKARPHMVRRLEYSRFDTLTNCALWHSDLRNSIICPFCGAVLFSSSIVSSFFRERFFFQRALWPRTDTAVPVVLMRALFSLLSFSRLICTPYRYKYFALFRTTLLFGMTFFTISMRKYFNYPGRAPNGELGVMRRAINIYVYKIRTHELGLRDLIGSSYTCTHRECLIATTYGDGEVPK